MPLADAIVTVWSPTRELARTSTTPSGEFFLQVPIPDTASYLAVRAIGYQQQWLPLSSQDPTRLRIDLVRFALALPEIAAQATAARCPIRDDSAGRQLWHALTARYTAPSPRRGMAAVVRQWTATVGVNEVGGLRESQLTAGLMGIHGAIRLAVAQAIDSSGYARRIEEPLDQLLGLASTNDLYFQWWYPLLESWAFEQWLAPPFGRRHTMALVIGNSGAKELVFCPMNPRQPGLAGLMHIGPDSTLDWITWEIRTKRPDEHPGGRVEFATLPGASARLQPLRGVYWRLVGGSKDRYLQRVTVFSSLIIGNGDTIPRADGPQ